MEDHAGWRLRLGEDVCRAYAADPAVAATAVVGSVARGWADAHSDVDVLVAWSVPPSDVKRRKAVERAGGRIDVDWSRSTAAEEWTESMAHNQGRVGQLWPLTDGEYSEHYFAEGIHVGVSGFLAGTIDSVAQELVGDCRPRDDAEILAAAVVNAMDVTGGALLSAWRSRLAAYPDELAAAIIARELAVDEGWWAVDQLASRNDRPALDAVLGAMQRRIFRILLALNRRYLADPRPKWSAQELALLRIGPGDLTRRWTSVQTGPAEASATTLQSLFEETLTLVERQRLAVGVGDARRWFRHRRAVSHPPV